MNRILLYSLSFFILGFSLNLYADNSIKSMKYDGKYLFGEDNKYEDANFLASIGIIKDRSEEPEKYKLTKELTRFEAIKLILKASNIQIENKCFGQFQDISIDFWGCKYIETAKENNLIKQKENFYPNNYITVGEFLKILFKLSNNVIRNNKNGLYYYFDKGIELGYIDNTVNLDDFAKRELIFSLLKKYIDKE